MIVLHILKWIVFEIRVTFLQYSSLMRIIGVLPKLEYKIYNVS